MGGCGPPRHTSAARQHTRRTHPAPRPRPDADCPKSPPNVKRMGAAGSLPARATRGRMPARRNQRPPGCRAPFSCQTRVASIAPRNPAVHPPAGYPTRATATRATLSNLNMPAQTGCRPGAINAWIACPRPTFRRFAKPRLPRRTTRPGRFTAGHQPLNVAGFGGASRRLLVGAA